MADSGVEQKSGFPIWKLCRWAVLGAMVIVLLLMLKKPPSVAESMAPEAAKEQSAAVQTKLADLETAHQRGEAAEARFSSVEINGVLQQAQTEQTPAAAAVPPEPASKPQPQPEAAEPAPEISTTRIAFEGDHATGQFVVHAPGGKDIYLTISGKIKAVEGYASFEFTEGKIGDMPVPVALLNSRLQAKLQEPETRPKLKLPEYVADIRVENGQLVMTEK
jgi:hypothetical protein